MEILEIFLIDGLSPEEVRRIAWRTIPLIPQTEPTEELSERRMLELQPISTSVMGNRHATKLSQGFKPTLEFSMHSSTRKMNMGVLKHCLTLCLGRGRTKERMTKLGWNLRIEAEWLPPFYECPTPNHHLIVNIIIWNSRGVLKPNFQNHVRELARNHNPAIMVIMETRLGGERAREITDRLPFDDAIHTETIGFVGGLWLLWNSDMVEIEQVANT